MKLQTLLVTAALAIMLVVAPGASAGNATSTGAKGKLKCPKGIADKTYCERDDRDDDDDDRDDDDRDDDDRDRDRDDDDRDRDRDDAPTPTPTAVTITLTAGSGTLSASGRGAVPTARRCVSRRALNIRLREFKGQRLRSARVSVNGKLVKVVRRDRLRAHVNLTGLPKGRFLVRITAVTTTGRRVSGVRAYRTCTPRQVRDYKGKL